MSKMLFTLWSTLGELLSCVCGLQPYGYIGGALTLTSQSCYLTSFLPRFKPSSFFTTLSRSSPTVHNPPFTSVSAAFPSAQRLRPAHTHFPSETYQVLHCPTAPGARCSRNCSSSSAPQQCFSFEIKHRSGTGQANSGRHQEAAPGTAWSHPRGPPARDLPLLCSQGPSRGLWRARSTQPGLQPAGRAGGAPRLYNIRHPGPAAPQHRSLFPSLPRGDSCGSQTSSSGLVMALLMSPTRSLEKKPGCCAKTIQQQPKHWHVTNF